MSGGIGFSRMMQQLFRDNRELLKNASYSHFKKAKGAFKGSFRESLLNRSNPEEYKLIKARSQWMMNFKDTLLWVVLTIFIVSIIGLMIYYFG